MAYFANDLQPSSLVVHEAKIHNAVYDDSRSKTTRKWYWCVSDSLNWRLEKIVGWRGWCVWWDCSTNLQVMCNDILHWLMGIWADILWKDTTHVLFVRKTSVTFNLNMERRQYTQGIEDFVGQMTSVILRKGELIFTNKLLTPF